MKDQIEFKKLKVGLPITSSSYSDKTPPKIKMVGETLSFIAGVITIIAGATTPPGWVVILGGIFTIAGRHISKMFSYK